MPDVRWSILLWSAALLSLERICYVWIAHSPAEFRRWCERSPAAASPDPVVTVRVLFVGFKAIQALVFAWWVDTFGQPSLGESGAMTVAIGVALVAGGQVLNFAVFRRLGATGVFYGREFGHPVPRVQGFPFSLFEHPQYVGTVLSIWGLFVLLRFPYRDWWVLPALETFYYSFGARLEGAAPRGEGGEG